jgi:hypothetical protein
MQPGEAVLLRTVIDGRARHALRNGSSPGQPGDSNVV